MSYGTNFSPDPYQDGPQIYGKTAIPAGTEMLRLAPGEPDQPCSIFLAEGTSHHKFVLDKTASKFDDLLVIYLATMAKLAIESPTPPTNSVDFKVKCLQTLLDYCHRFDVKLKGTLKKMKEANTEGKLKEYFTQ